MTDFKQKRINLRKQFTHHRGVHENAQREFAGTAVMLDRAINPLIRKYGIKVGFSSDVSVFPNDSVYLELRFDATAKIYRKDMLAIAHYIWELLAGCAYEKGGVYNVKYWETDASSEQRGEFHYHPERFPVRMAGMKMKIPIV